MSRAKLDNYAGLIADRAFGLGYDAYQSRAPRQAPPKFGTYSGSWIDGWDAAALDGAQGVEKGSSQPTSWFVAVA
ncbi:hypothetical protein BH11PSE12_BH11PSE12_29190 [soil metagenome]